MKKLILTTWLALGTLSVFAGGYGHHHPSYDDHHACGSWAYPTFSFYYGAYPYSYSSPAYPSASPAYPAYGYDGGPGYSRPNYAVSGTMLGAMAGGLIGDSIDHQGWEGAGIGAAAGLLLGSLAEHHARASERAYYAPPAGMSAQPSSAAIAPAANTGPAVADPPRASAQPGPAYRPAAASPMSAANNLFGR